MNATRLTGGVIGLVFGAMLFYSGMTSPDVIRKALLFEDSYMYFFMMSAMGTAALGQALLKRAGRRAVLVDTPIAWRTERPQRRHIVGAIIFGVGWGVSNSCPGPIASQVGGGSGWAVFTFIGAIGGIWLFMRRESVEHEPAADNVPAAKTGSATPEVVPA